MSAESVQKLREGVREYKKQERQEKRLIEFNRCRKTLGEENDISDRIITSEEIATIGRRVKQKGQITDKDLALLKYGLLQSNNNIVAFLKIPGALHSLVREMTDLNSDLALSAIDCCCNLSLGEPKACIQVAKAASPYLISYLHGLNYRLMNSCLWTFGNLAASDIKTWRIIRTQGLLPALLCTIEIPELLENSTYALLHYVRNGLHEMEMCEMEKILETIFKMKYISDEMYWTLHLLTYVKELHGLLIGNGLVKHCLERLCHLPVNAENVNTITPLLRIIGNLVTEETGQVGLALLHEWDAIIFISEVLLASGYQHLCNEFCWVIGNIVNHQSPMIAINLQPKLNELVLLEQKFLERVIVNM